jgi:hypothetical protein
MSESESERTRRRWITVGELIALAALIVSAFGVWISWKSSDEKGPTEVVEQRQPIALTLRGKAEDDGRALEISPVENSHALQSLKVTIAGAKPIEIGSDGQLDARSVEAALPDGGEDAKGRQSVTARIDARYVEMGKDKGASGTYRITYRWEGGGLFGGRSLRLISLSR